MRALCALGASGAWHSPQPVIPGAVRMRTSTAWVWPLVRDGLAKSSRFHSPTPPVVAPAGGIVTNRAGGVESPGVRITNASTEVILTGPTPVRFRLIVSWADKAAAGTPAAMRIMSLRRMAFS